MVFSQDDYIQVARELGRSTEFIAVTTEYSEKLVSQGLPVIFSTHHLSLILGLDFKVLSNYIINREKFYKYYQIKKRNGKGNRQIVSPHNGLKQVQYFIAQEILGKVQIHPNATGFVKKKSIYNNAKPHANKEAILNLDLLKFFDTITERRVFGIFADLGYAKNLAVDLAKICTTKLPEEYIQGFDKDHLKAYRSKVPEGSCVTPQGAPSSPFLSNLVLRNLDKRLSALSVKQGNSYTRYADDITFSGKFVDLPRLSLLKKIIDEEGMIINWQKVGIYKRGRRQMVTGLTVSNDVHIPRAFKREVAKHIYGCLNFGVENHLNFIGFDKSLYKEWLLGKIYYIKSIEPIVAKGLMEDFNKIVWPI